MATPTKILTPEKQFEMNLQLDRELATVIKTYQTLEDQRGKKSGSAKAIKTLKVIDLLKQEFYNVISDVTISESGAKKMQDTKMYNELMSLLNDYNELRYKVKERESFLKEIDDLIKEQQDKIGVLAHKVPSNIQWQQRVQRAVKTLEALENKLDTFVKQYGLITTEARSLRQEIDHMLTERKNFNHLWYTYVFNLTKGKKILMDVIEQSTLAYNSRDEYILRLQALRTFAINDFARNSKEMEALQRRLDNDRSMERFMAIKEQFRNMKILLDKKTEKRMKRREEIKWRLSHNKQILNQIQDFVGVKCESSTTKFVAKFTSSETENLTYFNYINDLHNEIEQISNELVYNRIAIERQRETNQERASQQKITIESLKLELKVSKKESETAKVGLESVNKVLKQIYSGLDKLFKICKCSNAPFLQLLGQNAKINQYNVLLYLKVLEDSVSTYLSNVYYREKTSVKTRAKYLENVIDEEVRPLERHSVQEYCPVNTCPLCVDREMVSDLIDTLQFVQTKEEVRSKLAARLQLPDGADRLHNVSACNLPKSRQIIQRRFQ